MGTRPFYSFVVVTYHDGSTFRYRNLDACAQVRRVRYNYPDYCEVFDDLGLPVPSHYVFDVLARESKYWNYWQVGKRLKPRAGYRRNRDNPHVEKDARHKTWRRSHGPGQNLFRRLKRLETETVAFAQEELRELGFDIHIKSSNSGLDNTWGYEGGHPSDPSWKSYRKTQWRPC